MRDFQTHHLSYERHTMQSYEIPPPDGFVEVLLNPGQHILVSDCVKPNRELLIWCKEYLKHMWSYDILITGFRTDINNRYQLKFLFADQQDAVLFKLSWV